MVGMEHKYIGMTADMFRKRYAKHAQSFRNQKYANETKLSKKVWELKESEGQFNGVKFRIKKTSKSYSPGDKLCMLCINEKLAIMDCESPGLLNNRIDFFSKCRHNDRHKMDRVIEKEALINL